MRKIIKESEAWFALAKAFEAGGSQQYYLCPSIDHYLWPKITHDVRSAMQIRLRGTLDPNQGSPKVAYPEEGADVDFGERAESQRPWRVLACLMFGWEAKSEGR